MEGNFCFEWVVLSAEGEIESFCTQTIYGETLSAAVAYFESFHGPLAADENGSKLEITKISLV